MESPVLAVPWDPAAEFAVPMHFSAQWPPPGGVSLRS